MITLKTSVGDFGPFRAIQESEDRWMADGVCYFKSVVGDAQVVNGPPDVIQPEPSADELSA